MLVLPTPALSRRESTPQASLNPVCATMKCYGSPRVFSTIGSTSLSASPVDYSINITQLGEPGSNQQLSSAGFESSRAFAESLPRTR